MIPVVTNATYKGDYRIEIEFDDGGCGIVDFSSYASRGGVFTLFDDHGYFRAFRVDDESGTLVWGDEVDIAPETLYALATGRGYPEWMTRTTHAPVNG